MGLQAQLAAQLVAGPSTVSDTGFPSGVTNIAFGLNPPMKQYSVAESGQFQLNQPPPLFTAIPGIGTGGKVTQVLTFYARCLTPMLLQMTFNDPNGGPDLVSLEPLNGAKLSEYSANGYLKGLAVQGSGQFEYWVSGVQ